MQVFLFIICIILVSIVAWFFGRTHASRKHSQICEDLTKQISDLRVSESATNATLKQALEDKSRIQKLFEDTSKLLQETSNSKVKAETEVEEIKKQLQNEKELLSEAESKLKNVFTALAGETLSKNTDDFLKLAKQSFETILAEAKGDISKKEEAVKNLVDPVSKSLEKFSEEIRKIELSRAEAYTKLETQIQNLASNELVLQQETRNLVNALRTPRITGKWGQIVLHRVVELSGMTEHIDFNQEVSTTDDEGAHKRPDMIVHLPNDRKVVVDAKASFNKYQDAINAETKESRDQLMSEHATNLKNHVDGLESKNYWKEFNSLEFVIMFIPGESFFSAALEQNPDLLEYAMMKKVIIATPTTLLALLRAISYGWNQEKLAKNALEISKIGSQIYDRLSTLADNFTKIGNSLKTVTSHFNATIGTLEGSVLPSARKIKELGVSTTKDIGEIQLCEAEVREISKQELLSREDRQ